MASIDLHVAVDFIVPLVKGNDSLNASGALARVTYHDGSMGLMLYLKPWLPEYLTAGVLAYSAEHPSFPHESTADQFFEENQFGSYRALGEQIATQAFANAENYVAGDRLRHSFEQTESDAEQAAHRLAPLPNSWE